ncbi:MAG TPA: flavodoxin family protein [Deferrisomatales bacterium]|nr:flavodoxin family protein [Deferrisomatales bacterium]
MKILGISGSTRKDEQSGTLTLVRTVLEATGCEYELVSLRGKTIGGCVACLGCVKTNVCVLDDDLKPLREKIDAADAYVIGAPNFYTGLNGVTHAFLERWYQFRHRTGNALWGKLAVAVGVGGGAGRPPADEIEKFMLYSFVETVAKVSGQGAASCFSCGYGETCQVGVPVMLFGEGVKITEDLVPSVTKQPNVMKAAREAGKELGARLREGHDRAEVTRSMQQVMMRMFKESS